MKNNLVVIVLARGNSKRLKNKNLQLIGGKTLVQRAIEIPISLGYTTIVSSENRKIINIAKKNGAIPHFRDKILSQDSTTSEEVTLKILNEFKFLNAREILLLQPTSPLRQTSQFVNFLKIWEHLKNTEKVEQAISVTRETADFWVYRKKKPVRVRELATTTPNKISRRSQQRECFFRENGLYYISNIDVLIKKKSFIKGNLGLIETDKITAIDIDDKFDLEIARLISKKYE
jgi:CMP-N-acetylneuraminic acid synthetase